MLLRRLGPEQSPLGLLGEAGPRHRHTCPALLRELVNCGLSLPSAFQFFAPVIRWRKHSSRPQLLPSMLECRQCRARSVTFRRRRRRDKLSTAIGTGCLPFGASKAERCFPAPWGSSGTCRSGRRWISGAGRLPPSRATRRSVSQLQPPQAGRRTFDPKCHHDNILAQELGAASRVAQSSWGRTHARMATNRPRAAGGRRQSAGTREAKNPFARAKTEQPKPTTSSGCDHAIVHHSKVDRLMSARGQTRP